MKLDIEDPPINITCPACGHETPATVRKLERNNQLTCTACGVTFAVQLEDALKGFNQAEKAVEKLAIDLHKLLKK